jgi:hypothetical protein
MGRVFVEAGDVDGISGSSDESDQMGGEEATMESVWAMGEEVIAG